MGVMVKMHNGDVERYETADAYHSADGQLYVNDSDANVAVALFAPGAWAAAWEFGARKSTAFTVGTRVARVALTPQMRRRLAEEGLDADACYLHVDRAPGSGGDVNIRIKGRPANLTEKS